MTLNHECDNDADESHTSIDMPKSDNDTCVTPAPVPTIPPYSFPNHPPARPKAAPPDPVTSVSSQQTSSSNHGGRPQGATGQVEAGCGQTPGCSSEYKQSEFEPGSGGGQHHDSTFRLVL